MSIESERRISQKYGVKRQISMGALTAGNTVQYDRNADSVLRSIVSSYGRMNAMFVMNNSDEIIAIDLDFTSDKRYIILPKTIVNIDQVIFYEFNVTNLSATDTSAGEVLLYPTLERPLARERL